MSERKPKAGGQAGGLADDYVQAQRHNLGAKVTILEERRKEKLMDARCHAFEKEERCNTSQQSLNESEKVVRVQCYNCGQLGQISTNCLEKALYCGGESKQRGGEYLKEELFQTL